MLRARCGSWVQSISKAHLEGGNQSSFDLLTVLRVFAAASSSTQLLSEEPRRCDSAEVCGPSQPVRLTQAVLQAEASLKCGHQQQTSHRRVPERLAAVQKCERFAADLRCRGEDVRTLDSPVENRFTTIQGDGPDSGFFFKDRMRLFLPVKHKTYLNIVPTPASGSCFP